MTQDANKARMIDNTKVGDAWLLSHLQGSEVDLLVDLW